MRSVAFTIIGFMIVLNLSVGLVTFIANGGSLDRITGTYVVPGMSYDPNLAADEIDKLESETQAPSLQDVVDAGEKLLDFLSLGLYSKVKALINVVLYALPNILLNIGIINRAMYTILFGFLSFIYLEGAFEIFTGKSLFGRK